MKITKEKCQYLLDQKQLQEVFYRLESLKIIAEDMQQIFKVYKEVGIFIKHTKCEAEEGYRLEEFQCLISRKIEVLQSVIQSCRLLLLPKHQQDEVNKFIENKLSRILNEYKESFNKEDNDVDKNN